MTLDEAIARLVHIRSDNEDAGSWPLVVFVDQCCVDVTDIVVGSCIPGTVVEIWTDDDA